MPSKKAERKAASRGTDALTHRAQAKEREDSRREAREAKAKEIYDDPVINRQLREAVSQSESFEDLWDNPMVRAARAQMTPEQIEQYERIGREMYGTIDFENINESKAIDDTDALEYIESALRSGLRPCDLEENERNFMENEYGEQWYERYGGYGCPLPSASADEAITARKERENAFLRSFGGERIDFIKELGGKS